MFQRFDVVQIRLQSIPKKTRVRKVVSDPGNRIEDRRGDSRNGKTGAEASRSEQRRAEASRGEQSQEERREETRIEGNDREAEEKRDRAPRTEKERNRGVVVPADDEVALLLSLNTTRGS